MEASKIIKLWNSCAYSWPCPISFCTRYLTFILSASVSPLDTGIHCIERPCRVSPPSLDTVKISWYPCFPYN